MVTGKLTGLVGWVRERLGARGMVFLVAALVPGLVAAQSLQRLGDLALGRASFSYDGVLSPVEELNGRALLCLGPLGAARLWSYGATPESGEFLGTPCPIAGGERLAGRWVFATERGEIWVTDATAAGTALLSTPDDPWSARPVALQPLSDGSLALFLGAELWVSDGTAEGTRRVIALSDFPAATTRFRGKLLFALDQGWDRSAFDLWTTDGTAAGTRRVTRVSSSSGFSSLEVVGDRVLWLLPSGVWTTDGTLAGTLPGVSFERLEIFPSSQRVMAVGDGLAFEAVPEDGGLASLWWTDGSPARTRELVRHQVYGGDPAVPMARLDRRHMLYVADQRLWVTDGTPAGTRLIEGCAGGCPNVYDLTGVVLDGALWFRAHDERRGLELWRSDGTANGTRVHEVCPGACGFLASPPVAFSGGLAFVASRRVFESAHLWVKLPGAAPRAVAPLGEVISVNGPMRELAGRLYLPTNERSIGLQMWVSDATVAGTMPLTRRAFALVPSDGTSASWAAGEGGVIVAREGGVTVSDGTPERTRSLAGYQLVGGTSAAGIVLRFREAGVELIALSVPSGDPTTLVSFDFVPGQFLSWTQQLGDDRLAFVVSCGYVCAAGQQDEIWITDGSSAGTARAFLAGTDTRFAGGDGQDFFLRSSGAAEGGGTILWSSDGTPDGTVRLVRQRGILGPVVRLGDAWYFTAEGRSFGREIWTTDGTAAGTRPLFPEDGGPRGVVELAARGEALLAAASEPATALAPGGSRLWRIEPLAGGAARTQLAEFGAFGNAFGRRFGVHPEFVLFLAAGGEGPVDGRMRLWTSDGTVAGTRPLDERPLGGEFAYGSAPAVLGRELYFSLDESRDGKELWASDGTPEGTRRVRDLHPGPASSNPGGLVAVGERLYFVAGDGVRPAGLFLLDPFGTPCALPDRACLEDRLGDARYEVDAVFPGRGWAAVGEGFASAWTARTATLSRSVGGDPEVVVQVVTATDGLSDRFLLAGLTRRFWIATLTDTVTGAARRYVSWPGHPSLFDDTRRESASRMPAASSPERRESAPARCRVTATRACLAGRFGVSAWVGGVPAPSGGSISGLFAEITPQEDQESLEPVAFVRLEPLGGIGGYALYTAVLGTAPVRLVVVDTQTGRRVVQTTPGGAPSLRLDRTSFAGR